MGDINPINEIEKGLNKKYEDIKIDCIWYLLSSTSDRIQEGIKKFVEKYFSNIFLIFIITKCDLSTEIKIVKKNY
jgi:hypothetical protein